MRHYWLDRVVELVPGRRAVGVKCVALAEDHFDAHFPGNPVLPGVCLLEGIAQTAGVLLHETTGGRKLALMVSIERVRFGAFARPGDQVRLAVDVEALVEPDTLLPPAFAPFWRQAMETWLGHHLEPADG